MATIRLVRIKTISQSNEVLMTIRAITTPLRHRHRRSGFVKWLFANRESLPTGISYRYIYETETPSLSPNQHPDDPDDT
jgi:hypothetical protein